ncbi:HAD family acid phosphatase [Rosettibacter firmus]|uniref:HAD family acid phosphatase n=1 Tax=Rosettibacter firmus TaxID=3111522 RepID=UPI00336BB48C
MQLLRIYSLFIILFLFSSCTSLDPAIKIINLDAAKNAVQNYYESGLFDYECSKIIDKAIKHIEKIKTNEKSSVVFDIDETALSNYEYIKSIGFGFRMDLWNNWINEGKARSIPQTKRFYDYLISRNIRVIFITGRYEEERDATIRNLIEQGYTKFDTLIARKKEERNIPAAEFKALKREELVKKGYEIIANIGDQWSDLVGGNSGYKIKLPNYLYLID